MELRDEKERLEERIKILLASQKKHKVIEK